MPANLTAGEKIARDLPSKASKTRWTIIPIALAIGAWIFLRSGGHPALTFFAFVIPFAYLWDDAWVVHRTLHSEERMTALKKIEDKKDAKTFVYGRYRREIKNGLCIVAYFSTLVIYFVTAL